MEWKELTVSGAPPPPRDYVTICNLANKVRQHVCCVTVLTIHSNSTVIMTGIKFDEIASKLHFKNMTDLNLMKYSTCAAHILPQ